MRDTDKAEKDLEWLRLTTGGWQQTAELLYAFMTPEQQVDALSRAREIRSFKLQKRGRPEDYAPQQILLWDRLAENFKYKNKCSWRKSCKALIMSGDIQLTKHKRLSVESRADVLNKLLQRHRTARKKRQTLRKSGS